jgi:multiple sugar transport system permease protein/raffinose/stachyose/melibiose transport system permease protein
VTIEAKAAAPSLPAPRIFRNDPAPRQAGEVVFRWLFLLPAVAMTVIFFILPLVFIVFVSPMRWNGIGQMEFIGWTNFTRLFADPTFRRALTNTLLWIAVGLFIHVPLSLAVALALYKRPPLWKLFRTAFFIPSIISTTALALLWYFVFNPEFGILNALLRAMGLAELGDTAWLGSVSTAVWASQVPYVIYVGFPMMIFLTQIASIPEDYFEAARIDGASDWEIDRFITVPLIKPAIMLNALFVTTHCLRMFEYPFIMTDGGPANSSTNLSLFIYKSMVLSYDYGRAMAASGVAVVVGLVVVGILFIVGRITPGNR